MSLPVHPAPRPSVLGSPLSPTDLSALSLAGIDADLAERALLRRVDSATGADIVGRNGTGDFAGIVIPYIWPGTNRVREYRLRRDRPDVDWSHGVLKPRGKYLSPPGRSNMVYFVSRDGAVLARRQHITPAHRGRREEGHRCIRTCMTQSW
jgi:hypothetical protein